ncbi:MAG: DUF1801 domain-containing protein [Pseudomonadales bacterium]|nr:DUF1801 domain-containing protein [Pseudomonadales bacterium]
MILTENPRVSQVFKKHPAAMRKKLLYLRQLILEVASETEGVDQLEETLKWGEPSYLTKTGSTIRINCKKSDPSQYAIYFNCKTILVETFREIYRDTFCFEDNRAIVFNEGDEIPIEQLKHCIALALTYHDRKNLPMLGA